ncbi:hypothetical protein Gorai_023567, partial [Gossypium raimondii]|nr:hypothetical protein [Gossypium raimondii]
VWWSDDADGDWSCVQTLGESSNGHSSTVWSLAFNAKGDKLVTCSDDLTMKIWEADIIRMQSGDGYAPCFYLKLIVWLIMLQRGNYCQWSC